MLHALCYPTKPLKIKSGSANMEQAALKRVQLAYYFSGSIFVF